MSPTPPQDSGPSVAADASSGDSATEGAGLHPAHRAVLHYTREQLLSHVGLQYYRRQFEAVCRSHKAANKGILWRDVLLAKLGQKLHRMRARERHWMKRAEAAGSEHLLAVEAHLAAVERENARLASRLAELAAAAADVPQHERMTIEAVELLCRMVEAETANTEAWPKPETLAKLEVVARIRKVLHR